MQMKDKIRQILKNERLVKYFVMAVCIVILELITFQLIYLSTSNYYAATIISFVVGVILNWIVGRLLVFGSSEHNPLKEFTMVLAASLVGVAIQVFVVYISVTILLFYPLIGKMLSIVFSFFWNYWFRATIVYKSSKQ